MKEKKENIEKQIRFLDDIPTEKDEIQLHSKIADSLLKIIETIEKNKKKVIGIFGSWGSGKSTVIRILKNKLKEKKIDTEFLIFDSWSHKGDFLKRAFLLELAKELNVQNEKHNLKNNNQKITIEKALTGKYVEKTIDPEIKIDWISKIILSIILLITLIGSLNTTINFLIPPSIYEILPNPPKFLTSEWSIFLLKTGLIIAVFFVLFKIIEPISKTYFFKKSDVSEVHSVKEDMEFMSHDYKKYFEEIIRKAKNELENIEKFIIVFDNLDRVEDGTLMNTLSLIQLTQETLKEIEKTNNQLEPIWEKFYFIIPIDRERLENTIKSSMPSEKDSQYAQDFIEKIIPYKIIIPDIYHNNWREFFNKRIKEAIPALSESIINEIRLIFEKIASVNNLTPRKIKNFINDLVENYMFWKDKIDIRLQALFIAWFYYRENNNKNSKLPKLPQKQHLKLLSISNEYNQKHIEHALLRQYYKTDSVCDVLIEEMIKNIENKDIQGLEKLINTVGEKHKVENCILRIWETKEKDYSSDINALLNLIYVIKEIFIKSEDYKDIYESLWKKELKSLLNSQLNDPEKIANLKEKGILEDLIEIDNELKKSFVNGAIKVILAEIEEEKDDESE